MNGLIIFLIVFMEIFGFNLSSFDLSEIYNIESKKSSSLNLEQVDFSKIASYPVRSDDYYRIDITGKSFLVYDLDSNRTLAQKEASKKRPIASITKLMTAVVALENIDLKQKIKVPDDINQVAGSKLWLNPGLNFKLEQLLTGMLVKSANDCAYTIAQYWDSKNGQGSFVGLMNNKAKSLELTNTKFADSSGLNEKNISTAQDLKKLTNYAIGNNFVREAIAKNGTVVTSEEGRQYQAYASNQMMNYYSDIFGIKTGYIEEAGHCFIAGSKNDHNIIVSIILDSGSTTLRFSDSRKLIDWARSTYDW